jgi:magnesium-transporting ATPase (P-type)
MDLSTAHWLYLLGMVVIIGVMIARKNVVVPAVAATFLTAWAYTHSFTTGLSSVFNASLVAASELFSIFLIIALVTALIERRAHGDIERDPGPRRPGWSWLLHGPWPLVGAGLLLAVLNIATLLLAGHPWSITFGFGLWGAKAAQAVGIPVESWEFWNWPGPQAALGRSVLADVTSVMNFGIILGAALAASLAGKFAPKAKIPLGSLLAAAIGGILMGYGARLSFGCNIGALFSGIASGSLHGWLWLVAAFAGSIAGIWLRPLFGLDGFARK